MNPYARLAVAAIAVVVAVGGAAYFLAPAGGQVGGPPTATALPTASPSPKVTPTPQATTALPSPSAAILADGGDVFPGTYVPRFDPPLTLTIGKEVEHNCAPGFRCRGSIDANLPGWLNVEFGQPRIEVSIVRVDKVNDPAHAGRLIDPPADLAAWIASRPGLTVIARMAVTVGGIPGTQLDLQTGKEAVTFGPITGVTDPAMGMGADDKTRLIVVHVAGLPIVIGLRAEDGSIEELQPLVDSIVWR